MEDDTGDKSGALGLGRWLWQGQRLGQGQEQKQEQGQNCRPPVALQTSTKQSPKKAEVHISTAAEAAA